MLDQDQTGVTVVQEMFNSKLRQLTTLRRSYKITEKMRIWMEWI